MQGKTDKEREEERGENTMNEGDRIRQMSNAELAREIFRWHEILFGTEFRFPSDVERFLNQKVTPSNIREEVMDELFS